MRSSTTPAPDSRAVDAIDSAPESWLNRNVLGMGLTSFLSDFGHEMATAILPAFLVSIGAGAAALGIIEGIADAVASFVKLGAGYASDRWVERKRVATFGYVLTGVSKATFALAWSWPPVLAGRVAGWFGRGIRGPVRDAMLADSVAPADRGRAFGFHRASDTAGAVAGPLVAALLVGAISLRSIFVLTLPPGVASAVAFYCLVRHPPRLTHQRRFFASLRSLPRGFLLFLVPVGLFGIADFAPTLLILRAQAALTGSRGLAAAVTAGVALYVVRNVFYAAASFPIGALSDQIGRRALLAAGYGLAALTFAGFAWLPVSLPMYVVLFGLAGILLAAGDTLGGALAADLLGAGERGLGYGVLGTVNGIGDLVSSLVVGGLWSVAGIGVGFGYAVVVAGAGALLLAVIPAGWFATR